MRPMIVHYQEIDGILFHDVGTSAKTPPVDALAGTEADQRWALDRDHFATLYPIHINTKAPL